MKTSFYIIKAILQGTLLGVLFFGVGLLCFLPVLIAPFEQPFIHTQIALVSSVFLGVVVGAIMGWNIINLHLEFDL